MLDAACPGEVFTSPPPDPILAATQAVDAGAGVVHIVKNYTGDVMNFEMAAELCQANGIQVESVVINDDVAVKDSLYTAGRRGVGTNRAAEKICGAGPSVVGDLACVTALGRKVNDHGCSMGMALTACTVPAAGKPGFELAKARSRWAAFTASRAASACRQARQRPAHGGRHPDDLPFRQWGPRHAGQRMGAPPIERTRQRKITSRCLVGNYITSLDMAGCGSR
jgi:dihydroxyacetone kinase-like protein